MGSLVDQALRLYTTLDRMEREAGTKQYDSFKAMLPDTPRYAKLYRCFWKSKRRFDRRVIAAFAR